MFVWCARRLSLCFCMFYSSFIWTCYVLVCSLFAEAAGVITVHSSSRKHKHKLQPLDHSVCYPLKKEILQHRMGPDPEKHIGSTPLLKAVSFFLGRWRLAESGLGLIYLNRERHIAYWTSGVCLSRRKSGFLKLVKTQSGGFSWFLGGFPCD